MKTKILKRNINPKELARIFLIREFIKIFDVRDKQRIRWVENAMSDIENRIGEDGLWNLLGEINDFKMKGIFHILTDSKYNWNKEEIDISSLTMTGLSSVIDPIIFKNNRNFARFAGYWRNHPDFQKKLEKLDANHFYAMPERDKFPIFVHENKNQRNELLVFDGMRRAVVAAIHGEKKIVAYVGRVIRKGKPRIQQSAVFHLNRLFHKSNKDKAMQEAYMRIIEEIASQFSDGKQTVKRVILYPSRDKELMKLYKKVFHESVK